MRNPELAGGVTLGLVLRFGLMLATARVVLHLLALALQFTLGLIPA